MTGTFPAGWVGAMIANNDLFVKRFPILARNDRNYCRPGVRLLVELEMKVIQKTSWQVFGGRRRT